MLYHVSLTLILYVSVTKYVATRWRYIHFRTKPKQILSALTQQKRKKSSLFTRIVILLDNTNVCFRPPYKLLRVLLMNYGIIDESTKPAS